MLDIRTGKELSRRDFGKGIAAILAAGCAPSVMGGMMRMTGARNATVFGEKKKPYIQSDGHCYFDTGLQFADGVRLESEEVFVNSGARQLQGSNVSRQYYGVSTVGKVEFGMLPVPPSWTVDADGVTRYKIVYHATNGNNVCQVYNAITGEKLFDKQGAYNSLANTWMIWSINKLYVFSNGSRIYGQKWYNGDQLIADIVPMMNGQTAELYDRVRNLWIHNSGSGTATYGED